MVFLVISCWSMLQAMTLLQNREPEDAEEKKCLEEIKLPFLLNLSFTYLKLEKPQKALTYGQKALDINPQNTKALFRCGQVGQSFIHISHTHISYIKNWMIIFQ